MKRTMKYLLTAVASLLFSVSFFAACSGHKNQAPTDFTYEYEREFVDECDADMTIDGVLDEARWQNQKVFTDKQYDVEVSYTTVFTEKGLYVGAKVKDKEIKWNARFNFATNTDNPMNSAFKINVRGPEVIDNHSMRSFNFYVDAFDKASRNQTRFLAASHTNGDVLKGEATEMTSEFFVTWDALNIELYEGEDYPEFVRIVPYYRIVRSFTVAGENRWIKPNGTSPDVGWNYDQSYDENLALNAYRPWSGIKFNADGYVNFDAPDATMGNSKHGYAKTDGWDTTQLSSGTLTSTGTDEQTIYFKDVYSESYAFTTKIKIKQGALRSDGTREQGPAAGICNFNTILESDYFYISGNTVLTQDPAGWAVHTIEKVNGWTDLNHGRFEHGAHDPATDYIEITCYKDKENYYYLINGEPFVYKRLYWLSGPTAPGLYSLSAETEFVEYTVTDYTGKETELDALIQKDFHRINVPGNIDGGKVTCDLGAVLPGESAELLIQPSSGNIMTEFEIKDAEGNTIYDYDYAVNNMELGVLKLENITSDLTVNATFTRLDNDVAITVKGKVIDAISGKAVTGANVVVTMPGEKRVFYVGQTTGNGSYNFKLPKAGTFTVGDIQIQTDGNYRIAIFADNFRSVAKTVSVPATATQSIDVSNVELEKVYVSGTVTINGAIYNSQKPEKWDLSRETENVVTALDNSSSAIMYFTEAVSTDAVIDFTITNKTIIGEAGKYEEQPCMGITATDGKNQFSLFVLNEGVRVSPLGGWSKPSGNEFNMAAPAGINYSLRTSENPQPLTFRYVKSGNMVALLYKDGDAYKEVIRLENSRLASMSAYALDVCNSKTCLLEFSNYAIAVGEDAADVIKDTFYERVELSEYDTASGTITLEGVNADGSIRYGESFTLVNGTTQKVVVTFNSKTQMVNVGGSIELTANTSGVIQVALESELTSVSGTIVVDGKYPNGSFNASNVIITAESATTCFVYDSAVQANGRYEIFLTAGEYDVSVTSNTFAARDTLSVGNSAVTNKQIILTVPFVTEKVYGGNWQYNADGSYQAAAAGKTSGYLAGATVAEGESFILEVEIDDMSTELSSAMGIVVGTTEEKYVEFALRTINPEIFAGTKYDFMRRRSAGNGNAQIYVRSAFENSLATEPFGANGSEKLKLTLVYHGGTYFIFFNDELTFTYDESEKDMVEEGTGNKKSIKEILGSGVVKFGLYSEGSANVGKFTSWSFTTERAALSKYLANTVTLPDGVTASVDGKALTPEGNVVTALQGDVVTLSKTIAANSDSAFIFIVNGREIETVCEGNVATATFKLTETAEVTYKNTYLVSGRILKEGNEGITVDLSAVTVTVYNVDGEAVATTATNANGEYSVYLPNGEYALVANGATLGSKATAIEVDNGAQTKDLALNTILVTEQIYGRDIVYDGSSYMPYYVEGVGYPITGGYLAGAVAAEGESFMMEITASGVSSTGNPIVGVLVGTTEVDYLEIAVRRFKPQTDTSSDHKFDFIRRKNVQNGGNTTTAAYLRSTFATKAFADNVYGADAQGEMKFALAYYAGKYYVFVNGTQVFVFDENTKDISGQSMKELIGSGNVKFGLFAEQEVKITSWNYGVGDGAVAKYLAYNVTLPSGVTASVDGKALMPENGVALALKGNVVTLTKTIAENEKITFTVNGNIVETVCEGATATATFTLTEDVEIAYENVYLLSGTVSNGIPSYALDDYSSLQVKVMAGDTEVVSVTPDTNGEFSVYAPNGEYSVVAVHSALTGSISASVESAEVAGVELVLNVPLSVYQTHGRWLVYDNGTYTPYYVESISTYGTAGDYLAGATVAEGATFAIETEVFNLLETGNPAAGFIVGSATVKNQFMTFDIRRFKTDEDTSSEPKFDFIRLRTKDVDGSSQIYARSTFTDTTLANTAFGVGSTGKLKMALVYYHGDYYIFFNDVLTFIFNENEMDLNDGEYSIKSTIGAGDISFGLFADNRASFSNWSYSIDEETVLSKYFPAGKEAVSSVGLYNRSLYYDNGAYHNTIPDLEGQYAQAGVYLAGAVAAEGATFAIETKLYGFADVTGVQAGIIVGSAKTKNQFMAFALRRFGTGATGYYDFVQERIAGIDNSQRVYKRSTFTDDALANADRTEGLTMALVYKEGIYNIFFKVNEEYVKAFAFDENATLDGADLQQSTKTTIGTGMVRFGLWAAGNGEARLTNWSYSLDEEVIETKYFVNA